MSGDEHTKSDHGHGHDHDHGDDAHGHDSSGHEAGVPFVPEDSVYDRVLSLLVVLAAVGLVGYMVYWMTVPVSIQEIESKGISEEAHK